jgi:hypothetical protein
MDPSASAQGAGRARPRPPEREWSSRSRAERWATLTGPRWSSMPPVRCSQPWELHRT